MRSARVRLATGIVAMLVSCASGPMHAQETQAPLESVLIGHDVTTAILSQQQVDALGRQLAIDINSVPVQTTTYASRQLGAGLLNYGTLFIERAFPIGAGTFHGFASEQAAQWADLDGMDLDKGDLAHRAGAFLDRPAIDARARIRINTQTTTIGGSYGVRPSVDVGAVMPIQRVCTNGSRTVEKVPGGVENATVDSCTTGIGDVQFRVKYIVPLPEERSGARAPILRWGLHAAIALPTGSTEKLTGKGTAQATVAFLMSKDRGWWQPTGYIGGTVGGSGATFKTVELFGQSNFVLDGITAPPSINFGGGVNFVDRARLTTSLEMIGQVIHNGVVFRAS